MTGFHRITLESRLLSRGVYGSSIPGESVLLFDGRPQQGLLTCRGHRNASFLQRRGEKHRTLNQTTAKSDTHVMLEKQKIGHSRNAGKAKAVLGNEPERCPSPGSFPKDLPCLLRL